MTANLGLGLWIIGATLGLMLFLGMLANNSIRRFRRTALGSEAEAGDLATGNFGYKQELLRDMGGFSNFALSFSIISILTGAVTLYGFGFNQGGPAVMGLGWPLVSFFVLLVAAGMAELASAIPTSGAVYHWSSILGGPGWGWFTGWMNLLGQITILAAIDFGCAGFVGALLLEKPTQSQLLTIYSLILLSHACLNHLGIKLVAILNDISAVYHVLGVLLLIGGLAWLGPSRPLSYLFETGFSTAMSTGASYGFVFLVGLLQAQWTFTGFDASAHAAEETLDATVRAPWGIFISVAVSSIFGFLMLALVTLSIKDPGAVAAAGNQAFKVALEQAAGTVVGRAMVWGATLAMWFCGLSAVTASSRMVYAFSRDGGMPGAARWSVVSPKFRTPVNAIWLVSGLALACGLVENIYAVVTSLSVIGLYVSYGVPLFLRVRASFRRVWERRDHGPWNLGRYSLPVNVLGVLWVAFVTILFVVSPSDVTLSNGYVMTYTTGKVFLVVCLLLALAYLTRARHHFNGPHLGSYSSLNQRMMSTQSSVTAPPEARSLT